MFLETTCFLATSQRYNLEGVAVQIHNILDTGIINEILLLSWSRFPQNFPQPKAPY
jgi:hypothetical protein